MHTPDTRPSYPLTPHSFLSTHRDGGGQQFNANLLDFLDCPESCEISGSAYCTSSDDEDEPEALMPYRPPLLNNTDLPAIGQQHHAPQRPVAAPHAVVAAAPHQIAKPLSAAPASYEDDTLSSDEMPNEMRFQPQFTTTPQPHKARDTLTPLVGGGGGLRIPTPGPRILGGSAADHTHYSTDRSPPLSQCSSSASVSPVGSNPQRATPNSTPVCAAVPAVQHRTHISPYPSVDAQGAAAPLVSRQAPPAAGAAGAADWGRAPARHDRVLQAHAAAPSVSEGGLLPDRLLTERQGGAVPTPPPPPAPLNEVSIASQKKEKTSKIRLFFRGKKDKKEKKEKEKKKKKKKGVAYSDSDSSGEY